MHWSQGGSDDEGNLCVSEGTCALAILTNFAAPASLSATCSPTPHQPGHSAGPAPQGTSKLSSRRERAARARREGQLVTGPQHASVGSKHPSHARRARPTSRLGPSRGASQGRSLPTPEPRRSPRSFPDTQSRVPSATLTPDPTPTLTYLNRYPGSTRRQGRPSL